MTRAATAGRKQNVHLMVNASKRTTVTTTKSWDWHQTLKKTKEGYRNHNAFFRNANRRNATELSEQSEQYMDPEGRKQNISN